MTVITHRERRTERQRDADRRTTAVVLNLGGDVRRARRRLRLTQHDLAARVELDQSRISQIERGLGQGVSLATWIGLGVALDQPLAVSFTRVLGEGRLPDDAGHLEMQEVLLGLGVTTGRRAGVERPSDPSEPRHATDVALTDDAHGVLILIEAWNTFGDVGAAIRSTHRKEAEALATAPVGYRVATIWVVRASAANRAIIGRYPNLFTAAFGGSSRAWVRALADGADPPDQPGLVWYDAARRRILEWRRP